MDTVVEGGGGENRIGALVAELCPNHLHSISSAGKRKEGKQDTFGV